MNRLFQCLRIPRGMGGFKHHRELQHLKGTRYPHGSLALQCRALRVAVHSILNTRMCLVVSESPSSAASAAWEDGELKHQQASCLRVPEPEQKLSQP